MNIKELTIRKIREGIESGDLDPQETADAYKEKIASNNGDINAYLEVFDGAGGIPIAIKDNILVSGKTASAASNILKDYTATYTATAAQRLLDAGYSFLGRTNMDEFAMGGSTETSAFGPTKNPHDPTRVPGGSSGGSAAAVAGGMAPAALGSDTGGSIRQPAAFCGLVGLKPTYGAVSRSGLIAMGSSLDQIGSITKTVEDAEILFNIMKGKDDMDATTLPDDVWQQERKEKPIESMVVGAPMHLVEQDGIDGDVLENFKHCIEKLKEIGVTVKEIEMPNLEYALAVYYIVMPAEVSSNLARFDGVKYGFHIDGDDLLEDYFKTRAEGFGKEVRRRIILGTYVLSAGYYDAYYNKAIQVRNVIRDEFDVAFQSVDAIITPTTPTPAFKIGEKVDDPLQMYLQDNFTVPANIVGIPAISVPSGTVEQDGTELPIGLQIMAPHTREDILFQIGAAYYPA